MRRVMMALVVVGSLVANGQLGVDGVRPMLAK